MAVQSSLAGINRDHQTRRRLTNRVMTGVLVICAVLALAPLFAVSAYIAQQGWSALVGQFPGIFTMASDAGELIDGLKGTVLLIVLSSLVGLPIGILSGIYLAEFGRHRLGDTVRFFTDVLAGVPSIVAGIVGYTLVVATTGHYSVFAGAVALGLLMFPTVTRATEGVVRMVPGALREGGLALGLPRWKVITHVVLPSALSGILTGVLLGVARVAGETAPLIFTILGNQNGFAGWTQPLSALPLQIFTNIVSPTDTTHDYPFAFAGVALLFLLVVVLNLGARAIAARRSTMGS